MKDEGVEKDEEPERWRLDNQRPKKQEEEEEPQYIKAVSLGALQDFLTSTLPEKISSTLQIFHEHVICTKDKVRIPFCNPQVLEKAVGLNLESCLLDFTFKTNVNGLLLGAVGPVGVHLLPIDMMVHMRFVPAIFMLADREDKDAHKMLITLFLEKFCGTIKYRFFDMAVLQGVRNAIGQDVIKLKRCLEHVKRDVKAAAHSAGRLSRPDLLGVLVESVQFSAWLPSREEFNVYWRYLVRRLSSRKPKFGWGELLMARYLVDHILITTSEVWTAEWWSGLGAVPLGITTYAPNCIERTHRTVKGLLGKINRRRDVSTTMVKVAAAVQVKLDQHAYDDLATTISAPPLHCTHAKRRSVPGRVSGLSLTLLMTRKWRQMQSGSFHRPDLGWTI